MIALRRESWQAILEIAEARKVPLLAVVLLSAAEEHRRRIVGPDWSASGKVQDPDLVSKWSARSLVGRDCGSFTLDVTDMKAEAAAAILADGVQLQTS
jgi:hypothetical protein